MYNFKFAKPAIMQARLDQLVTVITNQVMTAAKNSATGKSRRSLQTEDKIQLNSGEEYSFFSRKQFLETLYLRGGAGFCGFWKEKVSPAKSSGTRKATHNSLASNVKNLRLYDNSCTSLLSYLFLVSPLSGFQGTNLSLTWTS